MEYVYDDTDESRKKIIEKTENFVLDSLKSFQGVEVQSSFYQDLLLGNFWHTLGYIDGYKQSDQKPLRENSDKFRYELPELFELVVNQALLIPFPNKPQPGAYKGHTILLNNVFLNDDSKFQQFISPDLETRLWNGAFYENINDQYNWLNNGQAIKNLRTVLAKLPQKFDPNFVAKGLKIMEHDDKNGFPTLNHLNHSQLMRFGSIVKNIYEINPNNRQTQRLAGMYATGIIQPRIDNDGEIEKPFYYSQDNSRPDFENFLSETWIKELLESEVTCEFIVNELQTGMFREPDIYSEAIDRVMKVIPQLSKTMSISNIIWGKQL